MTATEEKWTGRIAAWRESGLTSEKFCEGREFTANGLRHWAYKLGQTKRRRGKRVVPIARVVRGSAPAPKEGSASMPAPVEAPITVEVGRARIVVQRGFDRATLAAVIDVVAERGGAR